MPVYMDCPLCGEKNINHGFVPTNGAMYYYHGNTCRYYIGNSGKVYTDELTMFNSEVVPHTPKTKADKTWIEARRADITGHPRKAKKLYKLWQELAL